MNSRSILTIIVSSLFIFNSYAINNCPNTFIQTTPRKVDNWIAAGLKPSCMLYKQEHKCQEIEDELEGEEKKKINQCDEASIKQNESENSKIPNGQCVLDGLVLSMEPFIAAWEGTLNFANWVMTDRLPGEKSALDKFGDAVADNYKNEKFCNETEDQKKIMVSMFNLTIEDERYRMKYENVKNWTCGQIAHQLSSRQHAYQKSIYDRTLHNKKFPNSKMSVPPLRPDETTIALEQASRALSGIKACYTVKAKADMMCKIVTSLVIDSALGYGALKIGQSISSVVKSKKALARINKSIKVGDKIDLEDAAKLRNAERIKASELILKRKVTDIERKAILEAHEVGIKEGRGFFTYTQDDINQKARLLSQKVTNSDGQLVPMFNVEERRMLMQNGITGTTSVPLHRNSIVSSILEKILRAPSISLSNSQKIAANSFLDGIAKLQISNAGRAFTSEEIMELAKKSLAPPDFEQIHLDRLVKEVTNRQQDLLAGLNQIDRAATNVAAPTVANSTANSMATRTPTTSPASITPPVPTVAERAAAAAQKEVIEQQERLAKIRATVAKAYEKDTLHNTAILETPKLSTADDVTKLKSVTPKADDRILDTIRTIAQKITPDEVAAFKAGKPAKNLDQMRSYAKGINKDNIDEILESAQKVTDDGMETFKTKKRTEAQAVLEKIYGKNMDIQGTISEAGSSISKSREIIVAKEKELAKASNPSTKQLLQEEIEKSKTIVEIQQIRCRKIIELYRAGYNISQFLRTYEKAYEDNCK